MNFYQILRQLAINAKKFLRPMSLTLAFTRIDLDYSFK